jgi:2-amino-4-hydroxy-6-hydroxymethyldihydropteridine diphosphokinase
VNVPPSSQFNLVSVVVVALGSNLGDSHSIVKGAFRRLQSYSTRPLLASSLWESAPIDCPPGSSVFINAVAALFPPAEETPFSLLAKLQALEREYGRTAKKVFNEPRTLDLDLVCFGEQVIQTPELILPHPRAHLRAFVLAPLNEILPDLRIPGQARTVQELLEEVGSGLSVRRVAPPSAKVD